MSWWFHTLDGYLNHVDAVPATRADVRGALVEQGKLRPADQRDRGYAAWFLEAHEGVSTWVVCSEYPPC